MSDGSLIDIRRIIRYSIPTHSQKVYLLRAFLIYTLLYQTVINALHKNCFCLSNTLLKDFWECVFSHTFLFSPRIKKTRRILIHITLPFYTYRLIKFSTKTHSIVLTIKIYIFAKILASSRLWYLSSFFDWFRFVFFPNIFIISPLLQFLKRFTFWERSGLQKS